jgi:RNA polymerase sigma factor (sigma-70 family)
MNEQSHRPRTQTMTSARAGLVLQHLRRLARTCCTAGSADGQLLDRFTAHRDEAAIAALVQEHGPMVLNVCRSVLRHEQDAEDAFQATFLVLARKAASIRQPEAVAGFLHEVAYHVAVKAQAHAARRRARERRAAPMAAGDPTMDMTVRDLQRVLHEELRRLPDKYRLPLVLCYLEGRSHEEAARQLGWSKSTFRGRLDRGREHLRRRLAGRGVALSALLGALAVVPRATAEALVESAVRAAVSAPINRAVALADGVLRALFTYKLKVATAVLLVVGLVATGAAVLAQQALGARGRPVARQQTEGRSPRPKPAAAPEAPQPPAADVTDAIAYGGRVLGPEGQPVPGSKLYLTLSYREPRSPLPASATTGLDGRFRFVAPKAEFGEYFTVVTATAANHGAGWVEVPADSKRDGLTLRLVADDVPVTGQVVDLEGKPVVGATLEVQEIRAAPLEDLGPWLEAARGKKGKSLELQNQYLGRYTRALSPQVTTDAEGRFRLSGIGRNRLIQAQLDGPTIASQHLHILTRPGEAIDVTYEEAEPQYGLPRTVTTYYGASFRHVAATTRPVAGLVRDRDTRKPVAGVAIRSYARAITPGFLRAVEPVVRTTTDD